MQVKSLIFAAGLAAAAPAPETTEQSYVSNPSFHIQAIRSGSDVHYATVDAAKSSLFLNLPASNASCIGTTGGHATFHLFNSELFLYTTGKPSQKVYVDRSGMGQGKIGYVTGAEPTPKNAETNKFTYTATNGLTFDGAGFIACPNSIDGAHSLWISAGVENPAGNSNCVSIKAKVLNEANPVYCQYT